MPKPASLRASLALPLMLLFTACSEDTEDTGNNGNPDAGMVDTGETPDTGVEPDAGTPDLGPQPCLRDQGGVDNRGCDPGEVCNLKTGECGPGKTCTQDIECNNCSRLTGTPDDCGHGYHVTAFCDTNHGSVCTRSRAPCEPCATNEECGRMDPQLGGAAIECLEYGTDKYCGTPCTLGCPDGFSCDANNRCRRTEGCDPEIYICPEKQGGTCTGTEQICPGEDCPGTDGLRCSTNNLPGAVGICINFCTDSNQCPASKPICNTVNGICIAGCTAGSCSDPKVCHSDGFCAEQCTDNAFCENEAKYGPNTYCNMPGQPPPRIYKTYRDDNACAPMGCERPVDCPAPGLICDKTQLPPACVDGCYEREDCLSGEICKSGPQGSYSRAGCRALDEKVDPDEIGVCCNPGCTDRVLQCDINDFCCAEEGSPYEDPSSCLTLTSTGGQQAEPGQCFEMAAPTPWCVVCEDASVCASGYTPGYNVDPNINGGQPFQEQEFCTGIAQGLAICTVTCNPNELDNACPRGWNCGMMRSYCCEDADCNGLECAGADCNTDPNNPVYGQCKCGENSQSTAACPTAYALQGTFDNPRCVETNAAGDMFCIAGYNCTPPGLQQDPNTGETNFPTACGF